ncbi:hypothetical protein [Ligilactobacillus equi]|nr:hypothetical protein [Ligilactobacillus equi]
MNSKTKTLINKILSATEYMLRTGYKIKRVLTIHELFYGTVGMLALYSILSITFKLLPFFTVSDLTWYIANFLVGSFIVYEFISFVTGVIKVLLTLAGIVKD